MKWTTSLIRKSELAMERRPGQCINLVVFELLVLTALLTVFLQASANGDLAATVSDMGALLRFKARVQEDPHGVLQSWTQTEAADWCSSWRGLTCEPWSKRVVKLELRDAGLRGWSMELLSELTALQKLEVLDLSGNRLQGEVVSQSFCEVMANLRTLRLAGNGLQGSIPKDLLSCGTLQQLDLSHNNLSGNLEFHGCGSLQILDISNNALSGAFPSSIGHSCKLLHVLNASSNHFDGFLSSSLAGLSSITTLDISNNHIQGPIPDAIAESLCLTLQHFHLSSNNLTGSIPPSFASCVSLKTLDLANNKLYGSFPAETVRHLSELEALQLAFNEFSGPIPVDALRSCGNLRVLDLSSNKLTGKFLPEVCYLPSRLEKLLLPNNLLFGELPAALANCSQLKKLDLSFNQLQGSLPAELGLMSGLENLYLWFNRLTGDIPKEFGMLSGLKALVLNNNMLSGAIPSQLANSTALEWICLSNNNLSGPIPEFIGALPQLTLLELANNSLLGSIPAEVANATKFLWVDLNSNYLSGRIPSGLGRHLPFGNVTRVREEFAFFRNLGAGCRGMGSLVDFEGISQEALSLSPLKTSCAVARVYDHGLDGDPDFSSIQFLDLSYNRFEGSIPEDMGYLTALQMLSLGHNQLVGTIPASFRNLRSLGVIDLSNNMLEGDISPLSYCSFLVQIDVSNNHFSGMIPTMGQLSTAPVAGFLNNPGLCGEPLPPCHGLSGNMSFTECALSGCVIHGHRPPLLQWLNSIILGVLIAVIITGTLIVWAIMTRLRSARGKDNNSYLNNLNLVSCQNRTDAWNSAREKEHLSINVATFERPLKKLTFAQLIEATNGFSQDSLIGIGGFGEVYKAKLKDGSIVAIKKLLQSSHQGDREFIAEMETLGKIKHRNLVPLLGYCKVGDERILVYEYMQGGSLEDMLYGDAAKGMKQRLTWELRKQIAKGAARGLAFLHHSCIPHIIHRDMKSSNVLLDSNLEARVSDFGMARLISALDTHLSVSTLAGTPGYVPPEYCQSFRCTTKGDVYSFGVVLLELLTGRRPTDKEEFEDSNLAGWVRKHINDRKPLDVLDKGLRENGDEYEMVHFLRIACECVEEHASRRPSMQRVASMMKEL